MTGDPYRTTNILFSSGTTGEPKAIPWNHLTPIKSAMDGYYHQDIHGDDVTAWPTNIGWMMGPWLIYATLVNGACMALYPGAANTPEYLRFIRRAGVTMQGVIPSLVRTWRRGGMAEGIYWPSVRVFSSTGEPASRSDYLWLMSRAGYRAPVIEYLGGTEIGGGHLACTVLQPCSPAAFTTANLGVDFVISWTKRVRRSGRGVPASFSSCRPHWACRSGCSTETTTKSITRAVRQVPGARYCAGTGTTRNGFTTAITGPRDGPTTG